MANTELTKLEFQSLQSVKLGHKIEMHMYARLLKLGLIAQKLGGHAVTDAGYKRLAEDN